MKLAVFVVASFSAGKCSAFIPHGRPQVSPLSAPAGATVSRSEVQLHDSPYQRVVMNMKGDSDVEALAQPTDRRRMLQSTSLMGLCAISVGLVPSESWAAPVVDFEKVKADIVDLIDKEPSRGPTLVRLAWHSSGTYDRISKTGGSQGGTMRFKEELADGANAGLYTAVGWLEPLKKKYPGISYGDLYTLAGATAIKKMGGPDIKWRFGRVDEDVQSVPPQGRLPDAYKGNPMATAQGLRDVFYRMGFNDREIVALSGAHALGRCHTNFSGYDGPWTPTPNLFAGSLYFRLLKNLTWTERQEFKPFQYQDPSGALMMLPSDIVLLQDKSFKKYVDMYADDGDLFFTDFAKAFSTLLELGTKNLKDPPAAVSA